MSFTLLAKIPPVRWTLYRLARWRVAEKMAALRPHLGERTRVLEIGAGNCVLCEQLQGAGHDVVALDVENLSFVESIVPQLYDGQVMPFDDKSFDVALLITVLHHCKDPNAVLAEARRVANRVVIIEEIYENALEKYGTYAIDSLFNLQFFDHPRSNKTDAGWKEAFDKLGLELKSAEYSRSIVVLRRVTYVVEHSQADSTVASSRR